MLKFYFLLIIAVSLLSCGVVGFIDEDNIDTCGGQKYSSVHQVCENNTFEILCGKNSYDPDTQFCFEQNAYDKCGVKNYNPAAQFCEEDEVFDKCGGENYNSIIYFCYKDEILAKCGKNKYDPAIDLCQDGILFNKCESEIFDPSTEYCADGIVKNKEEFTDSRDGNTYKYVHIGNQIWMAENLRHNTLNTKCYNDIPDNCEIFGVLYDWDAAKTVCPDGWHLPNDGEWTVLKDFVENNASKLKANSDFWISSKGTDDFGFAALPGGYYRNYFDEKGAVAGFWSATAGSSVASAHFHYLKYDNNVLKFTGFYINQGWANVRCIKD